MGYDDQAPCGFRKCSTAENPSDSLRDNLRATTTAAKANATMARPTPTRAKSLSLLIDYSKTPAPAQELEESFNDLVAAMAINPTTTSSSTHERRDRDREHEHEHEHEPALLVVVDSSEQHCSNVEHQDEQNGDYCMALRYSKQSLASTTDSCSPATATLLDQLPWQQHQDDDDDDSNNNNHQLSSASIGLPELAPIVPQAGTMADDSIIITSTVSNNVTAKTNNDNYNDHCDHNDSNHLDLDDSNLNYDKSFVSSVGSLPLLDLVPTRHPVLSSTGARFSNRRALLAPTRRYQSLSNLSQHQAQPNNHNHNGNSDKDSNVLSFSLRRRGSERNNNNNNKNRLPKGISRSNTWDYKSNKSNNNHINHGETMDGAGISSRERFHNSLTNFHMNTNMNMNMNISNHDFGVIMADLNTNNNIDSANNNMDNCSHHNNGSNSRLMLNTSSHHQSQERTPIQNRRARLVRHSSISALNLNQTSNSNMTPSLKPLPQIQATTLHTHHHTPMLLTTHQPSVFSPATRRRANRQMSSSGSSKKQPLLDLPQTIEIAPRSTPPIRRSSPRQPSSAGSSCGRAMVMRSSSSSHHGAASCTRRRSSTDTGTSAESNSTTTTSGSSKENRQQREFVMSASSHSYFPTTAAAAAAAMTSRERQQATLLATLASKHSCTNAIKIAAATTTSSPTTKTTTSNRRDMLTRSLSSRRHLGSTNIMKNTKRRGGSLHAHLVSTGAIVAGGSGNANAAMMAGFGGAKSVGAGSFHTADQSSIMDNDSSHFVTGSRIRRRLSSRDLLL